MRIRKDVARGQTRRPHVAIFGTPVGARALSPSDSHTATRLNAARLANRADATKPVQIQNYIYTLGMQVLPLCEETVASVNWLFGVFIQFVMGKKPYGRSKLEKIVQRQCSAAAACVCDFRSYRALSLRPPSVVRSPRVASPRRSTVCAQCVRSARRGRRK